ncbi:hypothetical protein E0493_07260 [Roseomonas sp. M0104]|uniref:Uncharacterized protein n=1 Tax=Teichococcus coralli TaxID=2545983 RepID=A0A845B7K8_9PROT|nr:hypothetical protein [Pseudoroseomonas coralli]MXP63151.1 hypothetical protein [Pseudoroseomonas coralli]
MHYRGRVAFERFWYARGPMVMVGTAYGITLVLAALTFSSLDARPEAPVPDRALASSARLLTAPPRAKVAPVLAGALPATSAIAACP